MAFTENLCVVIQMPELSRDIKSASNVLLKALKTINEAHLAHFSRRTHPEIGLVKHVRKKLLDRTDVKVLPTTKGLHEAYGEIVFLRQPDVDLSFQYRNLLHGVEFKVLRKVSFYSGLEEAIAYSTYGMDFSWIVHFFRRSFEDAKNYERWMKFAIERSKCLSVGYVTSTAQHPEVVVYPKEPFRRGNEKDLEEVVSSIRRELVARS